MKEEHFKNTTLDDSASIYQQRQEQTEKQKFSQMSFKEKVIYFNDYYKGKTITILIVTAVILYIAYSIATPDPKTVLYVASINNSIATHAAEDLKEGMTEVLNLDEKKEQIYIDTSIYIGNNETLPEVNLASEQKLATLFFAGNIDILIAPETVFSQYAKSGFLIKLSDVLTTEMCSYFAKSLYFAQTEESTLKGAFGIYLKDSIVYDPSGQIMEDPILGIAVNSQYPENAIEFIRYIYNLK